MNARREFLMALFRILERDSVPYCVLRNYQNIYEDASSDIDLAVEPKDLRRFRQALEDAAEFSSYSLIHQARYINYSYVYWHPAGSFIRVDAETEVRWRIFPILSAASVVGLRRKLGEFYVPHPRHESVVLFVAAIWRRTLSDRYRDQLAVLYDQIKDPEELTRTFRAAFGSAGDPLAECQAHIRERLPEPRIWSDARSAIMCNSFSTAPNRRALLSYLALDVHRLSDRLQNPPGISLLYTSTGPPSDDTDKLFSRLEFLYPTQKSAKHVFKVASNPRFYPGLSWRLQLRRLYTLFKGGLFMRYYHLAQDEEIPRVLRTLSRYLYPSRAFFCAEGSDGESWLGHVKTGFMTQFNSKEGAVLRHDRIIQFITTILPRKAAEANGTVSRGLFVVLLGLDGSGKTILARNLCALAGQQNHFRFARYFHWRPKLLRKALFPLPDFRERRPSSKKKPNALRSMLSVARLSKNLLLTNLAYFFRIKPLLRHNGLVLLDRYYYNYYLDPASVSYYGPKWLVDKARRFFPRPDLIVTLHASPNVLLSRKNELTEAEALSQNAILEQLGLEADHTLKLDASLPAPELARVAMQNITAIVGSRASTALASPSKPSKVLPWLPRFTNFMRTLFSFPRLAVCCLALVLVPMLGFLSISPIKNRARAIADDTLPGLSYAGAANANLAQANRVLMFVLSENADERLQLKKEIENLNQKTTSCLEAYKGTIYSSRDLAQFDELIKRRGEYFKVRERTMALAEHNNRREAGLLYQNALLPAFHRYKDAAERLFEYNVREGRSRGKTILTVCTLTQFAVAGAGVLIFVIGFLAGRSKERARYAFA